MAKSSEWFQQCFAEACKKSDHEYGQVQVAVREAIRNGESSSEYIRNQFGYNSDKESSVKGKTRKEFFNGIFNAVIREMRERVMFSAMNRAWGVGLEGISGLKTYLLKYTEMRERGTSEIKVTVTNKADRRNLLSKGIKPGKGNSFLLTDTQLISLIGSKVGLELLDEPMGEIAEELYNTIDDTLTGTKEGDVIIIECSPEQMAIVEKFSEPYDRVDNAITMTVEVAGKLQEWLVENESNQSLDDDFADEYERKLTKLIPCRNARMASFGVDDDYDYDAL
jgi:hypothetical protein